MNSPELIARAWGLVLAMTLALFVVMTLRHACRRWLGVGRSFQLWSVVPLALVASQLPHASDAVMAPLPPLVLTMASVARTASQSMRDQSGMPWQTVIFAVWLSGTTVGAVWVTAAQWRYEIRLRGAALLGQVDGRWPLWRAAHRDVGPALVGAWQPRIVVPLDFELRYDAIERSLILSHEAAHAARRDGCWSLCAHVLLMSAWFHPLAWWAYRAFRLDLELACDAAVLRIHNHPRQRYAQAMLKTQSAISPLPVGCSWSPRHPITERIAMLKQRKPLVSGRLASAGVIAVVTMMVAGFVYATTPSSTAQPAGRRGTDGYLLKVDVTLGGRPATVSSSQCMKPGEYASLHGSDGSQSTWVAQFAVVPMDTGQLEIRTKIDTRIEQSPGNLRAMSGQPIVRTMPGQQATIVFGEVEDGSHLERLHDGTIKIELTPSVGC